MRTRIMVTVVGALSALLMLVTATPASAASFNFQTAWNGNGAAMIDGHINYFGPAAADIQASIKDACPADGYGAYAQLAVTSIYGTTGYSPWIWYQNQGCSGTAVSAWEPFYWHNPIQYIRVHLCEIDVRNGNWYRGDCAYSGIKDNPYT
ncbi:MAG TPA: hypothetical protein VGD67_00625 [Pseudonocardiaceae bacterium]